MRKRWWFLLTVGVVATGAFGVTQMSAKPVQAPVTLAQATTANMENKIMTSGVVKVSDEVTVFSRNAGLLLGFQLEAGDPIQQGQVIGTLDMSDVSSQMLELDAQIAAQQANLAKTQTGLEPEEVAQLEEKIKQEEQRYSVAKKEYERMKKLQQSGAATTADVEKAYNELLTTESVLNVVKQDYALKQKGPRPEDLSSIKAQINTLNVKKSELGKQHADSIISAPTSGTVLSTAVKNGQAVGKGTEILTIGNLDHLIVEADVSESDIHKVKMGQLSSIEASALGGKPLQAKIKEIASIAHHVKNGSSEQTKVAVKLELVQKTRLLKPGFNVDVNITVEKADSTLQVPIEALQQDEQGVNFIWVAENGVAKKRTVELGIENALFIQIKSGIKPTDKVILNAPESLRENDPINPADAPPTGK